MDKNENVLKNGSRKLVDRTGNKDYYIGLDIGTNSVGWALTDDKYNLQKVRSDKKDKSTWGVRLFDDAKTAADRRTKRSMRRRLHRRRVRLNYLKALLAPEINKIDPSFFKRLENSYLYVNKDNKTGPRIDYANKNNIKLYQKSNRFHLFEGKGITDEEYYRDFPTIYHLRSALITGEIPRVIRNENGEWKTKQDKPSYNLYDPRLVFLALHSLLKSRGHFLYDIPDLKTYIKGSNLNDNINAIATSLFLSVKGNPDYPNIAKLYKNKYEEDRSDGQGKYVIKTKNDKFRKIKELVKVQNVADETLEIEYKERETLFYDMLGLSFGKSIKFKKPDGEERSLLNGLDAEIKIDFNSENVDAVIQKITDVSEYVGRGVKEAYRIYVWAKLNEILAEEEYLCMGKVKTYNKHKEDLHFLKDLVNEILKDDDKKKEKYEKIFGTVDNGFTYEAYVHHGIKPPKETRLKSFIEHIKSILGDEFTHRIDENEKVNNDIKEENFLPLERSSENSAIPNVLVKYEYQSILDKAKDNGLSFLDEADKSKFKNDGSKKTPYDKILSLVDFKIPYYVGPLAYERTMGIDDEEKEESINKWVVRKEKYKNKEIMPWVFDESIDKGKTRTAFITRMTSCCTYLRECKVLPKCSINYQKMMVLEELNNLCQSLLIKGIRLSSNDKNAIGIKHHIYDKVLKEGKSPTKKVITNAICDYCRKVYKENIQANDVDFQIGGEDATKLKNSLSSYIALKNIPLSDEEKEELIELYTVFGQESNIAREEAENLEYYKHLSNEDKDTIHMALSNVSGWGRYSKEFLTGLTVKDKTNGYYKNILTFLEETNYNVPSLLFGTEVSEPFNDQVNKYNRRVKETKNINNLKYKDLDCLFVPTNVKRAVWQSIKIVRELIKVTGVLPKKVFIETTRQDGEKGKVIQSRYKQIKDRYTAIRKQIEDMNIDLAILSNNEITQLSERLESNKARIEGERFYLYFMQCGKDMYTGENIRFEDIISGINYDVDHIYPRSLTSDDSIINNKVLVDKTLNEKIKGNKTLIASGTIKNPKEVQSLWKFLYRQGNISKEKLRRLEYSLSHYDLEDSEIENFANRQLVETSQSSKAVKDLLNDILNSSNNVNGEKTEIVFSKAKDVSDFRNIYRLYKNRDINDMHHAKDAYLNIIVGNVYNAVYTHGYWKQLRTYIAQSEKKGTKNVSDGIFNWPLISYGNEVVWEGEKTRAFVEKTIRQNDVLLTRMQTTGKGELFEDGVNSFKIKMYNNKTKNSKLPDVDAITPIKDKDVYYGYKDGGQCVAFFIYKQGNGKNKKAYICGLPQYYFYRLKQENKPINEIIESYITNVLKKKDVELIDNIILKRNFLLEKEDSNGMFIGHASGGTDLKQSFFPLYGEFEPYAMQICKFFEKRGKDRNYSLSDFNFRKDLYKDKDHKIRDYAKEAQRDAKRPKLTDKKNIEFLNFIVNLHRTESFKNRPGSIDKKSKEKPISDLEKIVQIFPKLYVEEQEDQEDQLETLYNLIKYMNGGRVKLPKTIKGYYKRDEYGNYLDKNGKKTTDLEKRIRLNNKKEEIFDDCGRMKQASFFSVEKGEKIRVINQSVTGLFENSFTISLDEE